MQIFTNSSYQLSFEGYHNTVDDPHVREKPSDFVDYLGGFKSCLTRLCNLKFDIHSQR